VQRPALKKGTPAPAAQAATVAAKRPAPGQVPAKQQPPVKKGPSAAQFFDGDDDEEEEDEEGDDEEEDDEEEEEPLVRQSHKQQAAMPAKAKTPVNKATTPGPGSVAGKTPVAKTPAAAKTPASAGKSPGTTPGAGPGALKPANAAEYEGDLVSVLRKQGRTGMSALGGAVAKPADVQKLAAFLKSKPDKFRIVGDQVELVGK
jgi:hypothetical protein